MIIECLVGITKKAEQHLENYIVREEEDAIYLRNQQKPDDAIAVKAIEEFTEIRETVIKTVE